MKKRNQQIQELSIAKIKLPALAQRKWENPEEFQELCASISQKGILMPLIVRPKNSVLEIIEGGRRFQAAQIAGLKTVPVIIRDLNNEEFCLFRLGVGINQKKLSVFDEALLLAELLKTMTIGKLAKTLSKSTAYINLRIKLLSLCDYAQEMVFTGKLSLAKAEKIANFTTDESKQKEYADIIINHKSTPQELALRVGKNGRGHRKPSAAKATSLKLIARLKNARELLFAVNENLARFAPSELRAIANINNELHALTEKIRRRLSEKEVASAK